MKKVLVIGGSNSKNSINKKLANYAANKIDNTEKIKIELEKLNLPIYGVDFHGDHGIPDEVISLSKQIDEADAIILSLAEHNSSYSTAFKNFFDWLSVENKYVWKHKPMLLLATSPGARGGLSVLESALGRFPSMGGNIIESMSFPSFDDNFKNNQIVNKELENQLDTKIKTFENSL